MQPLITSSVSSVSRSVCRVFNYWMLLDLDLLLDLRGLQFCLARTTEFLENSHIASLLGLPLLDHSRGGQRLMGMLKTTRPRLNAYSLGSS